MAECIASRASDNKAPARAGKSKNRGNKPRSDKRAGTTGGARPQVQQLAGPTGSTTLVGAVEPPTTSHQPQIWRNNPGVQQMFINYSQGWCNVVYVRSNHNLYDVEPLDVGMCPIGVVRLKLCFVSAGSLFKRFSMPSFVSRQSLKQLSVIPHIFSLPQLVLILCLLLCWLLEINPANAIANFAKFYVGKRDGAILAESRLLRTNPFMSEGVRQAEPATKGLGSPC